MTLFAEAASGVGVSISRRERYSDARSQALSFAIELRKVSAHYPRPGHGVDLAREAPLTEVSLAVEPGELLVVLGPNGAGKSTLLRVLAGTLATTSGDAFLFGAPLEGMD